MDTPTHIPFPYNFSKHQACPWCGSSQFRIRSNSLKPQPDLSFTLILVCLNPSCRLPFIQRVHPVGPATTPPQANYPKLNIPTPQPGDLYLDLDQRMERKRIVRVDSIYYQRGVAFVMATNICHPEPTLIGRSTRLRVLRMRPRIGGWKKLPPNCYPTTIIPTLDR